MAKHPPKIKVKRLDNLGREEQCQSNGCGSHKGKYIGALVWQLIWWYVVDHFINPQHLPWLDASYSLCLPFIYLQLKANLIANLLWLVYDGKWFKKLVQIALNTIGLATIVALYLIFPFNVSGLTADIIKLLLIIGGIGTLIAVLVEAVTLPFALLFGR